MVFAYACVAPPLDFRAAGPMFQPAPFRTPTIYSMSVTSRLLAVALACAAVAAPPAFARGADELADLINVYRTAPGSCGGQPALPAEPLTSERVLSSVRIGAGAFLESALKKAGYRSDLAEMISVTGPENAQAAMAAIRDKYCGRLLSGEFSAVGTARFGNEWQIILAHPLIFPTLPEPAQLNQELVALVNQARATPRSCGNQNFGAAPPIVWNETLAQAALGHSQDMATKRYFSHKEPGGSDQAARATRAGYRWTRISENIAAGQHSVTQAVADWLDSPGHCANIMNPAFTEMGAAWAVNPANENRTPYWTQMFGRP